MTHSPSGVVLQEDDHSQCQSVTIDFIHNVICKGKGKGKGKAIPLQAWSGPEGSMSLRLQVFKTIGTLTL